MARRQRENRARYEISKDFLNLITDEFEHITNNRLFNEAQVYLNALPQNSEQSIKARIILSLAEELCDLGKIDRATTIHLTSMIFQNPAVSLLTRQIIREHIDIVGVEELLQKMDDMTPNSVD